VTRTKIKEKGDLRVDASDAYDSILVPPHLAKSVNRRKFLLQVGALFGAGAIPFAAKLAMPARARRLEVARPALGTWVRVVVGEADPARASRAAEGAFAAIRSVDEQMSIHRRDSQVARVNEAAGERPVAVDRAVIEVVEHACSAARASGGIYDPTILVLMKLYGFYESGRNCLPTDREIAAALESTGYRHLMLDPGAGTIGIARSGVALDLGSIG